ncbi:MAG: GreA/GreB family elongation factor [Caryophanon sp.]|nr:GreA/GreB family elongation factor [Caryophanon sp.]
MLRFVEIIDDTISVEEKEKLEAQLQEANAKVEQYVAGVEEAKANNAKEEALLLEEKVKLEKWYAEKVQDLLNTVEVSETKKSSDDVTIGKTVTFIEVGEDDEEEYTIVGSAEADPLEGKISNDSPIAKGLLGKKVGDIVKIATPGGDMEVKIINIQ